MSFDPAAHGWRLDARQRDARRDWCSVGETIG